MVEVLHDALVLVHQHPQLQFSRASSSGTSKGGGDNDEDEFFSESQSQNTQTAAAARTKGQKEACSQTRKAYIERSLFGELYDLRETLRAHKSGATIFINKLMKSLMVEMPDLKDLDPKYGELEAEIDRQIESWNELGIRGKFLSITNCIIFRYYKNPSSFQLIRKLKTRKTQSADNRYCMTPWPSSIPCARAAQMHRLASLTRKTRQSRPIVRIQRHFQPSYGFH